MTRRANASPRLPLRNESFDRMRPAGATFHDRLLVHARDRADVPAFVGRDGVLRYGELPGVVRSLAAVLRTAGLGPGSTVALTARSERDHVLAALALLDLGVAQATLASRDPPALRERLARRTGATVVLGDLPSDAIPGLPWIGLAKVLAQSRSARSGTAPEARPNPGASRLYFTGSGTTGEPKVVAYAESDLARHAASYPPLAAHRVLRPAHVEYNNSKRTRLYVLWQGGTNVFGDGVAGSLRDQCARHDVTWLEVSPLHAADLVASCRSEGPLSDRVSVKVGGARVPIALRRELARIATQRLLVSYGTTETAYVAHAEPSMHDERESVGLPGAHAEVEVVRADGAAASPGEIGEIRLRTPGMATAYVGDAAASVRHFRDGWFMPGDLASLTTEGWLCLHGRIDDMMIMDGINIFPAEIERVLEAHPSVAVAVAYPVASPSHGQIPVAAVEPRDGQDVDAEAVLAFARARLGLRAPRRIDVVAALPRNPQGKVVRSAAARGFGDPA